jgi:hypothetical protein
MAAMRGPRIFYHCYDNDTPSGGQKHMYQHVDVLNRNGIESYVLHGKPNYRLTWFENETPVVDFEGFRRMVDEQRDYVVVSENVGSRIDRLPCRKVVFNKNLFYGYNSLRPAAINLYDRRDVVAAMAVSDHNLNSLRFAHPQLTIFRVYTDARPERFPYRPIVEKQREIVSIVKPQRSFQTLAIYHTLESRSRKGLVPGGAAQWTFLANNTEIEVAEILSRSLMLVFLSAEEGLPRLPLEGMLCGCLVAGYAAGPVKELLLPELSCEYADPIGAVQVIERILALHSAGDGLLDELSARGRIVALRFNRERQNNSVCDAWRQILDSPRELC